MMRYALVSNADSRKQLEAYLPGINYRIIGEFDEADPVFLDSDRFVGREGRPVFVIQWHTARGFSFDGYVKPRLASGSIHANEVGLDHPVMKLIPTDSPRGAVIPTDEEGLLGA